MNQEELNSILELHRKWIYSEEGGKRADLRGADMSGADMSGAKNLTDIQCARLSIVPEEGSFIAWKQARYWDEYELYSCIIKLEIPADAKRCNATGRKCRASKARVVEIQDMEGNRLDPSFEVVSCHDHSFHYLPGVTVEPREPFCEDRWNECSSGIHFYITREEAVYHL